MISELACVSVSKRVLEPNLPYQNEFDQHKKTKSTGGTDFHITEQFRVKNGFTFDTEVRGNSEMAYLYDCREITDRPKLGIKEIKLTQFDETPESSR